MTREKKNDFFQALCPSNGDAVLSGFQPVYYCQHDSTLNPCSSHKNVGAHSFKGAIYNPFTIATRIPQYFQVFFGPQKRGRCSTGDKAERSWHACHAPARFLVRRVNPTAYRIAGHTGGATHRFSTKNTSPAFFNGQLPKQIPQSFSKAFSPERESDLQE